MNEKRKELLIKYAVCFVVASIFTVLVFWARNFFTDDLGVNLQVLSDGFSISGILLILFSGLLFVSGEGALLGIGFVMRNVFLYFVPYGRKHHETYAQYRERKVGGPKRTGTLCPLITGLFFLAIGLIFTIIWYVNFYNVL